MGERRAGASKRSGSKWQQSANEFWRRGITFQRSGRKPQRRSSKFKRRGATSRRRDAECKGHGAMFWRRGARCKGSGTLMQGQSTRDQRPRNTGAMRRRALQGGVASDSILAASGARVTDVAARFRGEQCKACGELFRLRGDRCKVGGCTMQGEGTPFPSDRQFSLILV